MPPLDSQVIDKPLEPVTSQPVEPQSETTFTVPTPMLNAAANPLVDTAVEGKKSVFMTKGEKVHKWGTYLSVDWIFNAGAGAVFTYWAKFTPLGQKTWTNFWTKTFNAGLKPLIKNESHLATSVGMGNTFMSIIAGGMFTIPPLMALENNKVKKSIVQFVDKHIYGKETCETDPQIQQAHESIERAPPKNFFSGMTSRLAALAPLLALVLYRKTGDLLQTHLFDHIASGTKFTFTKLGFGEKKLFGKLAAEEGAKRWNSIHNEALGMDLGFGIPYAILHEFFYNMFSGQKKAKEQAIQGEDFEPSIALSTHTDVAPNPEPQTKRFTDIPSVAPGKTRIQNPGAFADKVSITDPSPSAHVH